MTHILERVTVKTIKTIDRICKYCKKGVLTRDRSTSSNQKFLNKFYTISNEPNEIVSYEYRCPVCNKKDNIFGDYPQKEETEEVSYHKW